MHPSSSSSDLFDFEAFLSARGQRTSKHLSHHVKVQVTCTRLGSDRATSHVSMIVFAISLSGDFLVVSLGPTESIFDKVNRNQIVQQVGHTLQPFGIKNELQICTYAETHDSVLMHHHNISSNICIINIHTYIHIHIYTYICICVYIYA